MSLINKLVNPGANIYYDQKFRNVFEDHLSFIKNNNTSSIGSQTIDPNTGARFAGDWRGLMLALGVFPYMHWYNMRLNGYTSTTEYDGTQLTIDMIDSSVIEKIASSYKTVRKN